MKQFFVDGKGELSMMRLSQFLVVVCVLIVFIAANVTMMISALKHGTGVVIQDFQPQMIFALGVIIAGKVIQSATAEKNQ